jgi:MraZ protein
MAVWQEIATKLAQIPQSQPEARAYVRQTLAGAVDVELDKLGRINIPGYLRDFAHIAKQTVLAGLYDHFEIWDDGTWEQYHDRIDKANPDFGISLKEFGI